MIVFYCSVHRKTERDTDKKSMASQADGASARIRYDAIRDAILTCARKPTRVSLIYCTETTTKKSKTEKLKSKTDMLEVTVKVWEIHVVSPEE